MPKCIACGQGNLFTPVNEFKLCPNCVHTYKFYIARNYEVFQESQNIVGKSRNIETRVSRMKTMIDSLYQIMQIENGVEIMSALGLDFDELLELSRSMLDDLLNIQQELDGLIIDIITDNDLIDRKGIINIITSLENNAISVHYDVPKMLPEMLERLERQHKIKSIKSGNKYTYTLFS